MMEFKPFPKMVRLEKVPVIVTEKIDGTNAVIAVSDEEIRVGSRNRWLTPEQDNYGLATAMEPYLEQLKDLLPLGYHYGEWAGPGIQKNPLGLSERRLFMFDLFRYWPEEAQQAKAVVPWILPVPEFEVFDLYDMFYDSCSLEYFTKTGGDALAEGLVIKIGPHRFKWTTKGAKWANVSTVARS